MPRASRANTRNSRNDCIKLRELLTLSCKRLDAYGVEMPTKVAEWWQIQKNMALIKRVNSSEFGMLQMAVADQEAREEAFARGD